MTLETRLAFHAIKNNNLEIAYINYKIYDIPSINPPKKIDGRVLVPSPYVKACDFLSWLNIFF